MLKEISKAMLGESACVHENQPCRFHRGITVNHCTSFAARITAVLLSLAVNLSSTSAAAATTASQLAFTTQPVNTLVGTKMTNVVVQLKDAQGSNVAKSGTAITLTLNTGSGLSGTTSVSTDASGKAAFANLVIAQAGNGDTLKAVATALKGATSSVFTVIQGNTSITLAASTNSLTYGRSVTFTASVIPVAPATGTLSGTVTFNDGITILGVGALNASGKATFTTNRLSTAIALHLITATYGGSTNFAGGTSSALSQMVNKAVLTVSGIAASNKVYDAKTTAALRIGSAALAGVVSGDTVTLNTANATGAFADKLVGNGKTVTVTGLTISGANSGDYILTQPNTTASITAGKLTVTASGINKVYDGTTNATVTLSDNRLAGDILNLTYTNVSFANKNVATGKVVSVRGIAITGTDASNYSAATTASTTANITAASLTVSGITANNKIYDAQTTATFNTNGAALAGVKSGDTVTLNASSIKGLFSDKNAGNGKMVTVSGLTISGTTSGNYTLTQPVGTANISARTLTVSTTGVNKIYDGTTNAAVTITNNRVAGDVLSVNYTMASFANKNAGNGKAVSVTGITISGTDAGNYSLISNTASATANIIPATLTVTAANLSRPYGAANPTLTASYSGFASSETLATSGVTGSPNLATTATANSPVSGSPYAITATTGSLTAGNYSFKFVNGTLTVTKAGTTVSVASGLNPALTNQNLIFTVTVNAIAPTTATPTGTVQFKGNGTNLGNPVSLVGGQGSLSVPGSALGQGSFIITAVYSDNSGNFNGSTNSLGQNQVVNTPAPVATHASMAVPQSQSDGCMRIPLSGSPSQSYVISASTDMIHWTAVSTNLTDSNGLCTFTDLDAKNYPSRFYKAVAAQ